MHKARVMVTLKQGLLDIQGEAITKALHSLGFASVQDVRVGKYLEITLEETDPTKAAQRVREMGDRLLANPIIEEFGFDLDPVTQEEGVLS
ncbi:MAG: phosphoribosylformylglycinamidine synthase subunit PurS [Armatimonadetes bacterium]|nr:phosphoribosylformylglycinamidine synthase subunit PurS [Armatimonadota bacterium]